jgi:hypothetical protein
MTFLQIARWQLAANKRTAQCDRELRWIVRVVAVAVLFGMVALTQIAPAWERVNHETQEMMR